VSTQRTQGGRRRAVSKRGRARFLEALAEGHSVKSSAALAGFHRRRAYELRDRDEAFASAWDAALEQGTEKLVLEGVRRELERLENGRYADYGHHRFSRRQCAAFAEMLSDRAIEYMLRSRGWQPTLAADIEQQEPARAVQEERASVLVRKLSELGLDVGQRRVDPTEPAGDMQADEAG
jgi:hypothetical protein